MRCPVCCNWCLCILFYDPLFSQTLEHCIQIDEDHLSHYTIATRNKGIDTYVALECFEVCGIGRHQPLSCPHYHTDRPVPGTLAAEQRVCAPCQPHAAARATLYVHLAGRPSNATAGCHVLYIVKNLLMKYLVISGATASAQVCVFDSLIACLIVRFQPD